MSMIPPSAGDPYRVPAAPSAYAAPSPSAAGSPLSGPPPSGPPAGSPEPVASRPSWVAWLALGLSALSFVVATSVGIVYAANSLSASDGLDGEGLYYDAGMPSWGSVELTDSGDVESTTLGTSVEKYVGEGLEEFGGDSQDVSEVFCEAVVQPKRNSVATCSATVQEVDSTVVLFFLNDEGAYLATLY